jgi:hypothetical protein
VLRRFSGDEAALVRAVLADLVDSQLLTRTGRGDATTYRAATDADRVAEQRANPERLSCLLWVAIHRYGPIDLDALLELVPAPRADAEASLAELVSDGRATLLTSAGNRRYQSDHYLIPVGHDHGWEAAVFDHYQALVTAICTKVQATGTRSAPDDLRHVRQQAVDLRERVERYNREHGEPSEFERRRFTAYVGQTFVSAEEPGARHEAQRP